MEESTPAPATTTTNVSATAVPEPAAFARPAEGAPPRLGYRSPADDPTLRTGGVLQGAAAICIAGFSILLGVPGVAWLFMELPRGGLREPVRVAIACVIILLALGGLFAAVVTARDYLSGRNRRRTRNR